EAVPHLATLSDAVWDAYRLEIEYERSDRTVTRILEPLGLVIKAGVWYLVARTEDQIRTYRVSRVVAACRLDERFERPDAFDLASYWTESSAAYERDAPRQEVVVRVRPGRLGRLNAIVGERASAAAERLDDPDEE